MSIGLYSLLAQSVEQFAPASGLAPVEAEGELFQIEIKVFGMHRSLVGS